MDSIGIEIDGLREMEKALLDLGAELGAKTLRAALRDSAKPVHEEMLSKAAVGDYGERFVRSKSGLVRITPGFMRSRVKLRTRVNRRGTASRRFDKNTTAVVQVGVFRVPYVVPVEYGTRYAKAQPFVRPAADKLEDATKIFKARLARRIELARRRVARQSKQSI